MVIKKYCLSQGQNKSCRNNQFRSTLKTIFETSNKGDFELFLTLLSQLINYQVEKVSAFWQLVPTK